MRQNITDLQKTIDELNNGGFPISTEFIRQITETDDSFLEFIDRSQVEYIKTKRLSNAEKKAVHDRFTDLYCHLSPQVENLRILLSQSNDDLVNIVDAYKQGKPTKKLIWKQSFI